MHIDRVDFSGAHTRMVRVDEEWVRRVEEQVPSIQGNTRTLRILVDATVSDVWLGRDRKGDLWCRRQNDAFSGCDNEGQAGRKRSADRLLLRFM